jgi:hypothetical protein
MSIGQSNPTDSGQLYLPGLSASTLRKKRPPILFEERTCQYPQCQRGEDGKRKIYSPKRRWQKYCSQHCRFMAYLLRIQLSPSRKPEAEVDEGFRPAGPNFRG